MNAKKTRPRAWSFFCTVGVRLPDLSGLEACRRLRQFSDAPGTLERTVDAHIKSLRAKLRRVAPDADPIQIHRGLGYSLAS